MNSDDRERRNRSDDRRQPVRRNLGWPDSPALALHEVLAEQLGVLLEDSLGMLALFTRALPPELLAILADALASVPAGEAPNAGTSLGADESAFLSVARALAICRQARQILDDPI